jgi:anti-anti-sigma regulatory factor
MLELMTLGADEMEIPVLPLPEVVDTPAVVFAGLLGGGPRPLVLDASAVRVLEPAAARLLVSLLRAKRDAGARAYIRGASEALRGRFRTHELAAWFVEPVEALFVCPDRDDLGFTPSQR